MVKKKIKISPSYKEKENRINVSEIRNAQILNEMEKVSKLNLSYRYRIAIIQKLIDDWRGEGLKQK